MIMRSHLAVVLAVLIVGATASTAGAVPTPDTSPDTDVAGTISESEPAPPPPPKWAGVDTGAEPTAPASTDESEVWFTVTAEEINDAGVPVSASLSVSGTGGTSTAGGCKTVRITNVGHTVLHFVAYKFWTQVYWCWNRDRKTITIVRRSWDVTNKANTFTFDGIVKTASGFYGWLGALYPRSGYYYNKTASFTNTCPLPKVCWANTTPRNKIHVHSNGTWWFSKTGAG